MAEAARSRLERDGAVASIVLCRPAAEPVRRRAFACAQATASTRSRAPTRARSSGAPRARSSPAASTSTSSRRPSPSEEPRSSSAPLLGAVPRLEALDDPDPGARPRALPDRRARGLARLRHDLGHRVGAVRARRGGRRADARRRRHAADGRARRAGPGARVRDDRRASTTPPTLERWNVVNRVVPDDELLEKGMRFAQRLADGPTKAHAATKRDRARLPASGGVDGGRPRDGRGRRLACSRPRTSGTRCSRSSRTGPGKATFEGR